MRGSGLNSSTLQPLRTWAFEGADIAVAWLYPAKFYVFACVFLTRCWSWTNQRMESLPFTKFFLFSSERYDGYNDPKKCKSDHNLSEKNIQKGQAFHLCAHPVQTRGKIWDRNSQNWAGHRSSANCSHHYVFSCIGTVFWSYLWMDEELGGATDIDRLLVSSEPSTPIFTLIGGRRFLELSTRI